MLASLAVILFVLVTNIDNTTEEVQKNKIFETFEGGKNKTMLICQISVVGLLPFIKLHGGTSLSANATRQTEREGRDRERELPLIKLFLLVEPSELGQKQLSVPRQ